MSYVPLRSTLVWFMLCVPRRFLQKYLQKETEALQAAKANVSAATQANRQQKMQDISSLVKFFIRCANKSKIAISSPAALSMCKHI